MVSWREPDLWSGCVRTRMVVADTGTILFHLRFPLEVHARLRKRLGRRGKLAALIIVILNTIDLTTVPETRCKLASDFYERADE
jgi:hypothetical protein